MVEMIDSGSWSRTVVVGADYSLTVLCNVTQLRN